MEDKTGITEPLVSIDEQAFQYAKANGITCTVEPSVVRPGAWRVKIPDHAFPTVLDKDDAHTFANYIEIVNRTTLVDAAKHFLPQIASLEAQVAEAKRIMNLLPLDNFKPEGEGADAADFKDRSRSFIAAMDEAREYITASLDTPTPNGTAK